MLAAHRNGGRTDLASFARAWDRYTGPAPARAPRDRARAQHAARDARGEHRARGDCPTARADGPGRERPRRDTGERHRARELRDQPGLGLAAPLPAPRRVRARAIWRATSCERPSGSGAVARTSPGRMNWISGTMQCGRGAQQEAHRLGDVLGLDHLLLGHLPSTQSVMAVSTKPGQSAVTCTPSPASSLCSRLAQARPRRTSSPSRPPASPARACRRSRPCSTISALPCSAPASLSMRDALAGDQVDGAQVDVELQVELLGLGVRHRRADADAGVVHRARRAGRSARVCSVTTLLISSSSAMLAATAWTSMPSSRRLLRRVLELLRAAGRDASARTRPGRAPGRWPGRFRSSPR